MLPCPTTHGHHQAATLLALQVVADLDEASHPVVLGAEPHEAGQVQTSPFHGPEHARTAEAAPGYLFPRTSGAEQFS